MTPIHPNRVSPPPALRNGIRALWSSAVWAVFPCMGIGVLGGMESLTMPVYGLITSSVCFLLHAGVLSVLGMSLLPERKPITPLRRVLFVPVAAFLTSIPVFFFRARARIIMGSSWLLFPGLLLLPSFSLYW